MAMFGTKKSKPSEGSELVLAYLEEAQRVRTALLLRDSKGREVAGNLVAVGEDRIALNTQGSLLVEKGAGVSLLFVLDSLRFEVAAKVSEIKPGSLAVELPAAITLAERRKRPRARMNAREGAAITALTGLFDGVGLVGSIENISETGLCMRVDRAMEVKTQRKMHLGPNILAVGQEFMILKLSKLPKCPPIELEGKVAYLDASQGLLVGITFARGKEALLTPVKLLVNGRATPIPSTVPLKTRRQPEPEPEPRHEPRHEPKVEPKPPEAPVAAAPPPPPLPPPLPPPEAPKPVAVPVPEAPPAEDRGSALRRVKKRTRTLLLAMPDTAARSRLLAFLTEDGYGRILIADTLTDLLEVLDSPGAQLILVDGGVAELQGLALASLLRHRMGDDLPPVLLAEDSVDAELVLGAQETGVAQILVKPYDLDLEFRQMLEGHLGIR